MSERHRAAVASYLLLQRGDQVLLGRRQNTGWYDGWYSIPAGKVEAGELPTDGLIREMEEEIGVTLNRADITFIHAMYREGSDMDDAWADYFYRVQDDAGKYTPVNAEPEKCDELDWFSLDSLPANTIPTITHMLDQVAAGKVFSEIDRPTLEQMYDKSS